MLRDKSNVFRITGFVFIIVVILLVSANSTPQVSDIVTFATALAGFGIILFQLYRDHKIKKADFIYNLNESFNKDDDIKEIYMKLKKSRDESVEWSDADGRLMGNYVMFFIIMEHLLDDNLIDMKMIDAIFSNKFFIFCNNEEVYKHQLSCFEINYPVLKLYDRWYNYRVKEDLPIHYEGKFRLYEQDNLFDELEKSKSDRNYIKIKPQEQMTK